MRGGYLLNFEEKHVSPTRPSDERRMNVFAYSLRTNNDAVLLAEYFSCYACAAAAVLRRIRRRPRTRALASAVSIPVRAHVAINRVHVRAYNRRLNDFFIVNVFFPQPSAHPPPPLATTPVRTRLVFFRLNRGPI